MEIKIKNMTYSEGIKWKSRDRKLKRMLARNDAVAGRAMGGNVYAYASVWSLCVTRIDPEIEATPQQRTSSLGLAFIDLIK